MTRRCGGRFRSLAATICCLAVTVALLALSPIASAAETDTVEIRSPAPGQTIPGFLTAEIRWEYPIQRTIEINGRPYQWWNYHSVQLKVSPSADMAAPIVDVDLRDHITSHRFAVLPDTEYFVELIPKDKTQAFVERATRTRFRTSSPRIVETTDSAERYRNPRMGAHFRHMQPVRAEAHEPLSPWYEIKAYRSPPRPSLDDIIDKLPIPVLDGQPEALDAYWYCWKTLLEVWYTVPPAPDHQAIAHVNCFGAWGDWGSSVVWDSAVMMYFARYGDQAYPFIEQLDNAYARQHENGFICQESDVNNREVYSSYPTVVPPLFSWVEWKYYELSGDTERLKRVFLPIVKNYEWWMVYMRRPGGLYWKQGKTEEDRLGIGDDGIMNFAVGANSFRAAEALYLARIAREIGRTDLEGFFIDQHQQIGAMVNEGYWDSSHSIYNDLCDPQHPDLRFDDPAMAGTLITELEPGTLYKPVCMLYPLFGQIATEDRAGAMIAEQILRESAFGRPNGVPNLSADSVGYGGPDADDRGSISLVGVWPPPQLLVQEGLKAYGRWDEARALAERYFNGVVAAYAKEKTIKECILADEQVFGGVPEFVGWGGLGPVANLIEYIIGLDVNVPSRSITWHITRTDRHGIRNLRMGDYYVDLICAEREDAEAPCSVEVQSGGEFDLNVILNGQTRSFRITQGPNRLSVE